MTPESHEAPLRILYQDDACVVVDKPAGMIVHRGWANDDRDLLRVTRDAVGRYVYPLHRLDRGASGAVLFALNEEAARTLNRISSRIPISQMFWKTPATAYRR